MYYKRITPDGNLDWLKEIDRRIANLETPPSGSMYIRDGTIVTTDPVTGGQTHYGTLPDGTRGFKPFIYDITPPPIATSPVAVAEPGVFIVTWDGLFVGGAAKPLDFECCNIIGHKIVGGTTVSSVPVGMTRRPLDITFVQTDVAANNETWQFSLEAEDYNGNRAAWSGRSAIVTMIPIASEVDLSVIEADIIQAQTTANNAQTAAATAQSAANSAAQDALNASNLAGSKGKVIIQPTAPAVGDQLAQNLWIDTTGGANTPKRWDTGTTAWVVVTDKAATDAAAAAVAAQATADQAFNNAAAASTAAGNAQTTADGKNRVWYQDTAPAGTSHKQNDIWFETDNDHRLSKWNATTNVWDVALIGNNAILANLDAGKITVGYILAAVLKAKSITVDKLVITSTDNLAVEADFGNAGSSWQLVAVTKTINATSGRGSLPAMRFTGTVSNQTSFNLVNRISVGAEDRFRGSIWVKSSVALTADTVQLKLRCYTTATAFTDVVVATNAVSPATKNVITPVNTFVNVAGVSPVLPTGTIAMEIFLSVTLPSTGAIVDIDYVGLTRAADGNLVVDGAIDGKVITAPYIQTDNTPDELVNGRGVKFNPLGLRAYNALGQRTFDLAASTGDISVTGTFSSGSTPGVDADTGQTIRAQMGIIDFQNFTNSPGLIFEKYNVGTGLTSPSGFIFYYFGGILMRSTTPSTVWTQFKNESYIWVTQDGAQVTSSNAGYVNNGTTESDNLNTRSVLYTRTYAGNATFNGNDTQMRIGTVAMPTATHNDEWLASWQTRADATYQRGIVLGGVSKFNTTLQVYESRSNISLHHDGKYSLYGRDTTGTLKSAIVSDGTDAGAAAFNIEMVSEDIEIRAGINAITDTTRGSLIIQDAGVWLYGPTKANFYWLDSTRVGITGNLHINGENNIKHHRAEFTTTGFTVAGGNANWDSGPVVLDTNTNRTKNNDFCQAGPFSGSISFTRAGYYSIQIMIIPPGVPGDGWTKLIHSNGGELIGMDLVWNGKKHESHISTVPIYFGVGEYVRSSMSFSLEHTVNVRWRVVRSTLNL